MMGVRVSHTLVCALCAAVLCCHASDVEILHSFSDLDEDGAHPYYARPLVIGDTLYGVTAGGGFGGATYGYGAVFSIRRDGSNYRTLHVFNMNRSNGVGPYASLVLIGDELYGTTVAGGAGSSGGAGVLFRVKTNGTDFTVLYEFGNSPGFYPIRRPEGGLFHAGQYFYGTMVGGGNNLRGGIYRVGVDGTGYTSLFEATSLSAGDFHGAPLVVGSNLYALGAAGGSSYAGALFCFDLLTGAHTNLHSFSGAPDDGSYPYGSLTMVGALLYGMTSGGGVSNAGTIFCLGLDGSSYTNLHHFLGKPTDGAEARGSLEFDGVYLYGMTRNGGSSGNGTIFVIGTNGEDYTILHEFAGESDDGGWPEGTPAAVEGELYGMTYQGGQYNYGTVFVWVPEPAAAVVVVCALLARRRKR